MAEMTREKQVFENDNMGQRIAFKVLAFGLPLSTFVITPGFSLDPINLPKALIAIGTGLLSFLILLFLSESVNIALKLKALYLTIIFIFSLFIPMVFTDTPASQQFFGVWGRYTGIYVYIAFSMIIFSTYLIATPHRVTSLLVIFTRTSYFISGYALIQIGDLDPINWAQKQPFATLGNINFMSAFLGLATTFFIIKVLEPSLTYSAKLHFLLISVLNIWIIQYTGSIQGLAIFLSGISFWFIARAYAFRRRAQFLIMSLILTSAAALLSAGVYGVGPMGKYLVQDTVLFRRDYWLAGIYMLRDNLFTGVGIDSYGDFYRLYRDELAADRTGPQRVTNTAHNVFLDVFTGGGLIPGFLFIGCFLFAILLSAKMLRKSQIKEQILMLQSLVVGYMVFCTISINQIGVATWGMGFTGLLFGLVRYINKEKIPIKSGVKSNSGIENSKLSFKGLRILKFNFIFIFSIFVSGMVPPVSAYLVDARFFSYSKTGNAQGLSDQAFRFGATVYHKEKLIEYFLGKGKITESLQYARVVLKETNYRSFYALVVVLQQSDNAIERRDVASRLQKLDPHNFGRYSIETLLTD